jgi:uncharacterized membrane protein YfcA
MLIALLIPLVLGALVLFAVMLRKAIAQRAFPKPEAVVLGVVVNFFDTLGIGSMAPTMAWLKFRRLVPDRMIPVTLIAGLTPPAMLQAIIFLILLGVLVDPVLLVGCIVAVVVGGLMGVPLVAKAELWVVQAFAALALIVAGGIYTLVNLHLMPGGGTATSLPLTLMIVAVAANFVFGLLLNFGIGNYAPTLIMLSLMGMDPKLAFPIMAGAAGMSGVAVSTRHVLDGKIDMRVVAGIALGGIPAVLVAAFVVKSMPVDTLRWLVIVVVFYAALVMARSAYAGAIASVPLRRTAQ